MKFQKTTTLIALTLACSVPSWAAKAADEGVPNPNAAEITNAGDETALATASSVSVFASGFNNPRGLKFGQTAFFMSPKGELGA